MQPAHFWIPGQIEPIERQLYYWLARHAYRGLGDIVEFGSFIGASSAAFAQGIRDNPAVHKKAKRHHVFDAFDTKYIHPEAFAKIGVPAPTGADFFPTFQRYTAPYADIIDATKTDIFDVTEWTGKPIEILFIDGAGSAAVHDHVVQVFYPHLIPGLSIVIDQDCFYELAYWMSLKNQIFAQNFEIMFAADTSLAVRYIEEVENIAGIKRLSSLSIEERAQLLDGFSARLVPELAQHVQLQRAALQAEAGDLAGAKSLINSIIAAPLSETITFRAASLLSTLR